MTDKAITVYQDLVIEPIAPNETVSTLVQRLSESLAPNWVRETEEERATDLGKNHVCMALSNAHAEEKQLQAANIWLSVEDKARLEVVNVVPHEMGKLTVSEYNNIVQQFFEDVSRLIGATQFKMVISSPTATLADFMDDETKKYLESCIHRLKSYKSLGHPLDEEKWHHFIFLAHFHGIADRFYAQMLYRWLTEVEELPDPLSAQHSTEYDTYMHFLREYDDFVSTRREAKD